MKDKRTIYFKSILTIFCLFLIQVSYGTTDPTAHNWLIQQSLFAYNKMVKNISPIDGHKGAVIASPSRFHPNYYFHWVRDAAIVMDAMINYDKYYADNYQHQQIRQMVFDYLYFTANIQNELTIASLGEPRFNVDGSIINVDWARPQNDSPALRAISFIHWANYLIEKGEINIVKEKMYDTQLPAALPIKKDLEYISHHWKDPTYDLWEEIKGTHFYTLMVTRRALYEGAKLAAKLNDHGAASWYGTQAKEIEYELQQFWDASRGYFAATINQSGGINYKNSQLDSSVILGLLHGDLHDGFLSWDDPRVLSTLNKIIESFAQNYPINQIQEIPGYAIGRYPEDKYGGTHFNGGNPWVLCTFAIAEAMYRYANQLELENFYYQASSIRQQADQFILRIKYHAYADGSLSEQINRYTGYMVSAEDLTWNYAALITTRLSMDGHAF